jgi:hypothetical protein
VRRNPNACPPCTYKCISTGTPAFFSAMYYASESFALSAWSSSAYSKNVGGVFLVTGISGFNPSSLSAFAALRTANFFAALVRIPFRRGKRQMSRVDSYRKVRAAAKLTPTDFVELRRSSRTSPVPSAPSQRE